MAATRIVILFWLVLALVMPTRALAFAGPASAPGPAPVGDAPPPGDTSKPAAAPTEAATTTPDDTAGDLTTQREQAAAATRADPSAANHHRDGQLAEQAGDYAAALAAYEAELAATRDAAERTKVQADLGRVRVAMRGRVADEPKSTHRKELDARWAPVKKDDGAGKAKTIATDPGPQKKDRIVKKWYFWVAIIAIAASAAAVTGIAVKAARDDKPDALDRRGIFGVGTPALRF
jgi:hypothetical protein